MKLITITLAVIFTCVCHSYTYAQDSAVVEYKKDSTYYLTILKNGNVGVGTGTPTSQFHTTGSVRFGRFKGNAAGDSILTTDENGNLKFTPRWSNGFGGEFQGSREVKLISATEPLPGVEGSELSGRIGWNGTSVYMSSSDSQYPTAMQFVSLQPTNQSFSLTTSNATENKSVNVFGSVSSNPVINLNINTAAGTRGISITPESFQLQGMNNNAAGDSVLTTDANGYLKFKAISVPAGQDSSWATDSINIWNKNTGNVGIGTTTPTAQFHTLGSMRFESFKNNLQGDSVLTTDTEGNLRFVYMPYGSGGGSGASYNFQNGLTMFNGNVSLGGLLQDSVKINLSGFPFAINNGGDRVWHLSKDGNVGIGASADANYKMAIQGDINLGSAYDSIGFGSRLFFNGDGNTDALWLQRYNTSSDVTELRVNIGDEGGAGDRFVVGYTPYLTTNWVPSMIVEAGGRVGIATDQITGQLSIGKDHGIKLSVGNSQWAKTGIVATAYDGTNGDYTDLLVPGAASNSAFVRLTQAGNVGIGTLNPDPQYKLSVNGKIRAKGLRVQSAGWADFVFDPGYKLLSLTELEKFVKTHRHLPEIPTAEEVMKDGQEVGDMQAKLLQKIEELTLYTIELNKQVKALEEKNKKLEAQQQQISTLQKQLNDLKKLISQ